ncbi:MAG: trypsin-like peptidase domain-containing protein, partial [Anaerolineales bacterium]|nr:trypsin-like peptidase domain-containing protein [Anaerolineales bacterium]
MKTKMKYSHKSMEERMFSIKKFLSGRGAVLASLLFTLALGITIGSIVSDGVDGAEKPAGAQELVMQGSGAPVTLTEHLSLQEGFSGIAKGVEPAVVHIYTESIVKTSAGKGSNQQFKEFFGDDFFEKFFGGPQGQNPRPSQQKRAGLGSGVIVDSKGYILTNYHVVAIGSRGGNSSLAGKIDVQTKKGKTYSAKVVGVDQETDLAVLKIESDEPLPYLKVGDSTKMNVGDWVLAIGSPFGFDQTLTAGIISATKRVIPTSTFGDYIQTDAAINPGNSGGPLVNTKGEVIGINTFISTTSGSFAGIGFAIPSETFVSSYNQLVTEGSIQRGWLGISMNSMDMTPEMAEFFGVAGDDADGIKDGNGVIVTQLIDETGEPAESGPAAKAGIKDGDVIVKFGKKDITELWDLRSAAANTPPGKEVPVVLVRKGEVIKTNV